MSTMHIVIDLETLGTGPRAPIVALGAAAIMDTVDPDALAPVLPIPFYSRVRPISLADYEVDLATIQWWLQQSETARAELFEDASEATVSDVLRKFNQWMVDLPKADRIYVYGNAASFDLTILSHAYQVEGLPKPWTYKQERCFRTIRSMVKDFFPLSYAEELNSLGLEAHHAGDDAMREALELEHLLRILNLWNREGA